MYKRQELERYLTEELGVKKENISIMDGKNDQGEQMNQIRNFITTEMCIRDRF